MKRSPIERMGKGRIVAAAFALSLGAPGAANAEAPSADVARAESFAAEAFEAYNKKDYQEAVVLYMKALEASPSADVLFNIARIYDTKLNDRDLAMSFYRRYIADPGADPQRVRTANTRLAELRELELAANEKPAVAAAAAASGGAEQKSQPPAASGNGEKPQSPPAAEQRSSGLTGVQWAGVATGIVGLGGIAVGTVFGLSAKSDADIAKRECDGNDCRTQAGVDAANDASTKADISTVAFIAGGALTTVGVVLLLSGGGSSGAPERDTAHLSLAPYVGPGSVGTQLSGRF